MIIKREKIIIFKGWTSHPKEKHNQIETTHDKFDLRAILKLKHLGMKWTLRKHGQTIQEDRREDG